MESSQEIELKRREFERQKAEAEQKEKEFYDTLNVADKALRGGSYDGAMADYSKALEILSVLGPGWESYIPSIQRTISSIQEKRQFIHHDLKILCLLSPSKCV